MDLSCVPPTMNTTRVGHGKPTGWPQHRGYTGCNKSRRLPQTSSWRVAGSNPELGIAAAERPMDDRQSFGQVLKRLRLAAGLTHEALAERASLGARTISDLERGVSRAPRADTLALLIEALELSPSQQALLEAAARHYPDAVANASTRTLYPGNLPVQLTSFFGREREATAVRDLLLREETRLVTLTGP